MSNKMFDTLRFICEVGLPALGTLYFALAKIWGFSYGTEIVGTISAVSFFIGTLIGVKRSQYNATATEEPAETPETHEEGEEE